MVFLMHLWARADKHFVISTRERSETGEIPTPKALPTASTRERIENRTHDPKA
jgi:hypothetical protein